MIILENIKTENWTANPPLYSLVSKLVELTLVVIESWTRVSQWVSPQRCLHLCNIKPFFSSFFYCPVASLTRVVKKLHILQLQCHLVWKEQFVTSEYYARLLFCQVWSETTDFHLTCSSPGPERPRLRGCVDSSKNGYPLCGGAVEVVVIGNGGDAKAGVVLRRGVGPIAVSWVVWEAGLPVIREFCCFFILTLDTAHSLLSVGGERKTKTELAWR